MKNKLFLAGVLFSSFLFYSCATKIKDISLYKDAGASKSLYAPSVDKIKSKKTSIVIYAIEDKNVEGQKSAISRVISTNIQNLLAKTNVSIVDRSALEKFNEEAILAASEGKGDESEIITAADYAIKGQIDNSSVFANYKAGYNQVTPGYTSTNIDGSTYYVAPVTTYHPPSCRYTGEISGKFEIYLLPSLELVQVIPLNGYFSDTVGTSGSSVGGNLLALGSWNFSGTTNAKCKNKAVQVSVLNNAAKNSIDKNNQKKVLNQFAAKGYIADVLVHKDKDDKYVIQITLGSQNGIRQETDLEIYKIMPKIDKLTGKEKREEVKVAVGRVSNLVEKDFAWAVIKDEDEARKISIGDIVKVRY